MTMIASVELDYARGWLVTRSAEGNDLEHFTGPVERVLLRVFTEAPMSAQWTVRDLKAELSRGEMWRRCTRLKRYRAERARWPTA